jgi:hypothetical protein
MEIAFSLNSKMEKLSVVFTTRDQIYAKNIQFREDFLAGEWISDASRFQEELVR